MQRRSSPAATRGKAQAATAFGQGGAALLISLAAAFGLAACSRNTGSFDADEPTQAKWDNLMALVEFKPLPKQPTPMDPVLCPDIQILDGTAADRVYAPGTDQSNESVRYQFSIDNVARGCAVNGGQAAMKVGVAGRVLLGPAGSPGTFSAPIRVAVVNLADGTPVVSKLYQVPTTVADGQTEAPFTFVSEPFAIPATGDFKGDYTIKVGFDSAGNGKRQSNAETASTDTSQSASDSSDATPHHHHHHHRDMDNGGDGSSGSPD